MLSSWWWWSYYPLIAFIVLYGRYMDKRMAGQPKTSRFLWSKTPCYRHDVLICWIVAWLLLFPLIWTLKEFLGYR